MEYETTPKFTVSMPYVTSIIDSRVTSADAVPPWILWVLKALCYLVALDPKFHQMPVPFFVFIVYYYDCSLRKGFG